MPRTTTLVLSTAALLFWSAASSISCSGTPTAPSVNVPFSIQDLVVGTGAEAANGKQLTVRYTGWLYDASRPEQKGLQFDSGEFTFVLGSGKVIAGWEQGVAGMKVGGKRRLIIPPDLAYKDQGIGVIPPNATLVFDVELVNVE